MKIYVCTSDEYDADCRYITAKKTRSEAVKFMRNKYPKLSICRDAGTDGVITLHDDPMGERAFVYYTGFCGYLVTIYEKEV